MYNNYTNQLIDIKVSCGKMWGFNYNIKIKLLLIKLSTPAILSGLSIWFIIIIHAFWFFYSDYIISMIISHHQFLRFFFSLNDLIQCWFLRAFILPEVLFEYSSPRNFREYFLRLQVFHNFMMNQSEKCTLTYSTSIKFMRHQHGKLNFILPKFFFCSIA